MSAILSELTDEKIQIAERNGISRANAYRRMYNGWSLDEAITREVVTPKRLTPEQRQIAKSNGIDRFVIHRRMKRGWTIDRAITEPVGKWNKQDGVEVVEIPEPVEFDADQLLVIRMNGLTADIANERIMQGWSLFDAITKKGELR